MKILIDDKNLSIVSSTVPVDPCEVLHTGTTLKPFKGVKHLSHWLAAQTPEDPSNNMNLFWDEQTGWLNHSDTSQCNVLKRVCFTCWHCHERAPSVCPVLSDNQAVQNLQPHARVSCGISAWGRARVPHPPRRDKGLDTEFKSTDVSFTPASWVQNVQIHSYSLTRASKWFLACIISAPKRERGKKSVAISAFSYDCDTEEQKLCSCSMEAMTSSCSEFWPQCSAHSSASVLACACTSVHTLDCTASLLVTGREAQAWLGGGDG